MKFKKMDRFKEGSVNEERNGVRHSHFSTISSFSWVSMMVFFQATSQLGFDQVNEF